MTAPPQGPPPAPRVALRIEQDVPCPDCGYNLRGLRLDGKCPECGRPTIDTFARPLRSRTGVLAEEMLRRPARLLVIVLAWWVAVALAGGYLPGPLFRPAYLALSLAAAVGLVAGLIQAYRVRRQALSRRGGSSQPLQDVAGPWLGLCFLCAAGGIVLATLIGMDIELPPLARILLIAGAALSATAAQVLAARAAGTVLRRTAQVPPTAATPAAAAAQVALIAVCIAPVAGHPLFMVARVIAGTAAAITWFIASFILVGKLREAQGSVASLGRSRRSSQ
jgi:hypothetical protein